MSDESPVRVEVQGECHPLPIPCPFCGGASTHQDWTVFPEGCRTKVYCPDCRAQGPIVECGADPTTHLKAETEAIRLWNTRFYRVERGWDPAAAEKWTAGHS